MRRLGFAIGATLLLLPGVSTGCGKESELPPGAVKELPPPVPAPAAPAPPPIAFIREGNVWVIRPDGTGARAVTRLENAAADDPAWSPDRTRIAFAAGIEPEYTLYARNIFVVPAAGGDPRQVTPVPRAGRSLAPERKGRVTGRVVRMHRGLKMPVAGFRVTAFGLRTHALTGADGRFRLMAPHGGVWVKAAGTHEQKRITAWRFASTQQGRLSDLGDMIVTAGDEEIAAAPAWSPDGRSIAYQLRRRREGDAEQIRLRRIKADGSDDELLHDASKTGVRGGPILYAGAMWYKASDGTVTLLDLESRRPVQTIRVGVSIPDALAVAPDGRTLATLRFDETVTSNLVLVRGGAPEVLATFAAGEPVPHALDFSPDGKRLVMDRRTSEGASDLWILEIDSREFRRLTDDGGSASPVWHGR